MYMEKLDKLKLQDLVQPAAVEVLTRASVNSDPVRPNRPLLIAMAAIAGLFLGICFALLQEFLDDRVNAPEDARRVMGVPALGYIPRIEKADQRLLTAEKAGGSLLESYRVLRSNVRFAAVGEPLNSIMVTSTAPGEGKSMTSCNLAIAMALDGKRVILVDADLRRPTVHEKFGIRNTPGLTNVLVGALPLDKALQDTEIENLQVLASGPIPPNPAELLNSNSMINVQEQLKQRADVVIYDSPPCLSVADAQVMSSTVDGVIYVVQLGSTKKSALRHGHELLRQAQSRVLGIVYNKIQVDNRRSDYYYGYYSYYHKAELPSKANGNGKRSNGSSEWEALTAQAQEAATPAAIAASETSERSSSDREEKV
jgi:capsular exopolysaccharide synthesis family protein